MSQYHTSPENNKVNCWLAVCCCNQYSSPPSKSTISSPVVTVKEGDGDEEAYQDENRGGSLVNAKVGELENITREGRSRRMRKEVVGSVQSLVGKKKFLVQF